MHLGGEGWRIMSTRSPWLGREFKANQEYMKACLKTQIKQETKMKQEDKMMSDYLTMCG